ncbi:MAG: TetR/AcrR family transcriptional regulator C-terminal domain-containing protein [Oscillospiraceae bacterium]|jgi:AcrR family transcriptional regulator|nr:TetR/AcrR family transcriptional regulator C-terminal domain-containing protein [Oscillospiraceae bacterium]
MQKNDHRIKLTKMMIRQSFLSLLREKPINKITIKELCEKAGINRATFYAHYEDIYALMDETKNELAESILHAVHEISSTALLSDFYAEICRTISEHRDSCEAIFGKYGDADFAVAVVELARGQCLALWRQTGAAKEDDLEMLYTFVSYGSIAVIRSWVQSGMQQPPEVIAGFIERSTKWYQNNI